MTRPRPVARDLAAAGVALTCLYPGMLAASALAQRIDAFWASTVAASLTLSIGPELVLGALVCLLGAGGARQVLGPRRRRRDHLADRVALGAVLGLAVWSVSLVGVLLTRHLLLPPAAPGPATHEAVLASPAWVQVVTSTLSPLAEEVFFRSALTGTLDRLVPAWASTALSSVVFAAYHFQGWSIQGAIVLVTVAVCGAVYAVSWRRGGLVAAATTHAAFNVLGIL